jgi:glycosyltransferase involved in cell wall biosynthesis
MAARCYRQDPLVRARQLLCPRRPGIVPVQSLYEGVERAPGRAATGWTSPRALRVAQVVPIYPPRRGGMGRVAQEYTVGLRERGHDVRVFTPRHAGLTNVPDYVNALAPVISVGNAAFIPSLTWRLDGFDIVHLHYPFFGGVEPVLLRRLARRRTALVVSYHMDAVADGVRGAIFAAHQRVVLSQVLAQADAVMVSSLDYAQSSALAGQLRSLPRLEVHPFGVDSKRFCPGVEPSLRVAIGADADTPVLLFVSALDPAHHFKGFPLLIDALRELAHMQWRLAVVGDGPLRSSYSDLARAAGLGERVHFAGDVSDRDLPRYYRAADLHLFPSTASAEAFGLVCLEAAASGVPTVASALPGVRRVVLNEETGLLVTPGDIEQLRVAVQVMLERPDLRRELGAAARARVEAEFDWSTRIAQLEKVYFAVARPPSIAATVAAV